MIKMNMSSRNWAALLVAILVIVTITIGALIAARTPSKQRYYFGFVNKTGMNLKNVSLYDRGSVISQAGLLVKGGLKTEGWILTPLPSEVEVRWEDTGTHRSAVARLDGTVPKNFSLGTVYFIIEADGIVRVKAVKTEDVEGNVRATK